VTVEGLITVRSGFGHGQTLIRFEAAVAGGQIDGDRRGELP